MIMYLTSKHKIPEFKTQYQQEKNKKRERRKEPEPAQ
jgi:hypothetical protein